jgi:TDG/mug DNA glycosylase family protein
VKPSRADLLAAAGTTIPDVLGDDLEVLFCGINPGLWSGWSGQHFARPGNRFWPALHRSGFTPRLLAPSEQYLLPSYGLGITNLVPRASARADELGREELVEGGVGLAAKVRAARPRWLAVVGVTAYRVAFATPRATVGPQGDLLGDTRIWVLPNPSGLNAHYDLAKLADEFARLREAALTSGASKKRVTRSKRDGSARFC